MKKSLILCLALLLACTFSVSLGSCKVKEGCGLEEKYAPPVDRSGKLSTKRGKSNLFGKKMRKKMRN